MVNRGMLRKKLVEIKYMKGISISPLIFKKLKGYLFRQYISLSVRDARKKQFSPLGNKLNRQVTMEGRAKEEGKLFYLPSNFSNSSALFRYHLWWNSVVGVALNLVPFSSPLRCSLRLQINTTSFHLKSIVCLGGTPTCAQDDHSGMASKIFLQRVAWNRKGSG